MNELTTGPWMRQEGIDLCRLLHDHYLIKGVYLSLTGGLLYKDDTGRKDCDILFYRCRQDELPDKGDLLDKLAKCPSIVIGKDHGFVVKAHYKGKVLDLFFPEWANEEDFYEAQ